MFQDFDSLAFKNTYMYEQCLVISPFIFIYHSLFKNKLVIGEKIVCGNINSMLYTCTVWLKRSSRNTTVLVPSIHIHVISVSFLVVDLQAAAHSPSHCLVSASRNVLIWKKKNYHEQLPYICAINNWL